VLLTDDVGEPLWAIFSRYDLIRHFRFTIYDFRADCNCEAN